MINYGTGFCRFSFLFFHFNKSILIFGLWLKFYVSLFSTQKGSLNLITVHTYNLVGKWLKHINGAHLLKLGSIYSELTIFGKVEPY